MAELSSHGINPNRVKQALAAGGYASGTWVQLNPTPSIVRIIASAGFDFIFIDMEHSSFSFETVSHHCDVARACGMVPIVRPYEFNAAMANRIQDIGAMGLMFHDISSREQVDEILHAMKYPPNGTRGNSANGPAQDYRIAPGDEMKRYLDEQAMLIIQVESREGVERIDEILAGGGVDVVEIGRGDLSTSYGVPQQTRHPLVLEAVDKLIAGCNRHGVTPGINCNSLEEAEDMVRRGIRCVSYLNDMAILVKTYNEAGTKIRAITKDR